MQEAVVSLPLLRKQRKEVAERKLFLLVCTGGLLGLCLAGGNFSKDKTGTKRGCLGSTAELCKCSQNENFLNMG